MAIRKPTKSGNGTHYDPLQFRIRPKDEAGHYEKVQTQLPPELDTEIKSIVASGMFDFDGIAGYLRWAAVHGVEFLKAYRPEYPSQIAIIRSISLENARSQVRREFKHSLEETAREAFELSGMGFNVEAAKHIHRVLNEVRKLDPEDPWREIFQREIKAKFGHLLRQGKMTSLIPELPEEDQLTLQEWIEN